MPRKVRVKYQLVLQFPASSTEDLDQLIEVEGELMKSLGEEHVVDGHDFGSGEMNLFIHTDDPNTAFEKARKYLYPQHQQHLIAAYRELKGDKYTVLWPERYDKKFRVI